MTSKFVIAASAVLAIGFATSAQAADLPVKAPVAVAPAAVVVQDCSVFYDDFHRRGFGPGVGPGVGLGFGTFEGAKPRYPMNEFPNWYGACASWGLYNATGTAIW